MTRIVNLTTDRRSVPEQACPDELWDVGELRYAHTFGTFSKRAALPGLSQSGTFPTRRRPETSAQEVEVGISIECPGNEAIFTWCEADMLHDPYKPAALARLLQVGKSFTI